MIASLMMYARPELAAENAMYWTLLRAAMEKRGIAMPQDLSNDADEFDVWLSPELALGQTCGMPFRTRLVDHVTYVGTPDFGLEGCPAGHYRSAVIVRHDDPRQTLADFADARLVYNQDHSQSGYGAMYTHAKAAGFWFKDMVASGAHAASARMVAEGAADIAAVDAQTWRYVAQFDAVAAKLRVLEWTVPTPSHPYIARKGVDADAMFDAASEAIAALDAKTRAVLNLQGIVRIPKADYMAVENPPAPV